MSGPSIFSSIIHKTDDDTAKAEILLLDPLGLTYEGKILEKQAQALTDPKAYIKARNDAIKNLQKEVYEDYYKNMTKYQGTDKIPEPMAKRKAGAFAKAAWDAGMNAINEDYPLSAVTVATERQVGANAMEFGEGNSIKKSYTKTQRAPKKAPKRAPKKN